jgi:uncharacterized radical SAM superfamily Fe-S cluster-containing enzyme
MWHRIIPRSSIYTSHHFPSFLFHRWMSRHSVQFPSVRLRYLDDSAGCITNRLIHSNTTVWNIPYRLLHSNSSVASMNTGELPNPAPLSSTIDLVSKNLSAGSSPSCGQRRMSPSSSIITPNELIDTIRRTQSITPPTIDATNSYDHTLNSDMTESTTSMTNRSQTNTSIVRKPSPILTDKFGRSHTYLRISLTERCNLRCVYCMPSDGVDLTPNESLLTTTEIQRLLQLFVRAGVTKLRLTGGEPTVRKDLVDIISSASSLNSQGLDTIGLTSNGLVLARKLSALIDAGLTHLNLSLDTLDPFQFELVTRRPAAGHALVLQSLYQALDAMKRYKLEVIEAKEKGSAPPQRGLRSVKINCVVINKINDREIVSPIHCSLVSGK